MGGEKLCKVQIENYNLELIIQYLKKGSFLIILRSVIDFSKWKIDLVKDPDLLMGSADLTDRQKSDLDRDLRSFAIRSSIHWNLVSNFTVN